MRRWKATGHYLDKAGTIVGVRAVALLAGRPEDFKKQCNIGRLQVPVPAAWVKQLLPGILALRDSSARRRRPAASVTWTSPRWR